MDEEQAQSEELSPEQTAILEMDQRIKVLEEKMRKVQTFIYEQGDYA